MRLTDTAPNTYATVKSGSISNVDSTSSMSQNPEVRFTEPKPHGGYYFAGGDVILQVENTLFKIHGHFITTRSSTLQAMLDEAPYYDEEQVTRSTQSLWDSTLSSVSAQEKKQKLLILEGDKPNHWETFLSLFYQDDPCVKPSYCSREWAWILLISHKYSMNAIEKSALDSLRSTWMTLNLVDLIVLSKQVDNRFLYDSALNMLASSGECLTLEDAMRIGIKAMHDLHVCTTQRTFGGGFGRAAGFFLRTFVTSKGERIYPEP